MSTLANRTSPGGRQHQLEPRLTTGVDGASLSESAASARREVYIVPHFLDRGTCVHLRAAMDGSPSVVAEILAGTFASDAHVRKALSIDVATEALNTIESRLDAERGALSRFFGTALTAREGADFLRYQIEGFYGPHRDRATGAVWPPAARRRVAVVVFLNDAETGQGPGPFSGGELRLLGADVTVVPQEGSLVAFPASLLHEVAPVTRGVRDVVVDWFYD